MDARRRPLVTAAWAVGVPLLCGAVPLAALELTRRGWAVAGGVLALLVAAAVGRHVRRTRAERRRMDGWGPERGWAPAPLDGDRPGVAGWPWDDLVRSPELVEVRTAFSRRAGGIELTAGEIAWTGDAFGDGVDRDLGHGVHVVVQLPYPVPGLAIRAYRHPDPLANAATDEFARRFRIVGDSFRTANPDLRYAHLTGRVPSWTVTGGRLFAVVPVSGPMSPEDVDHAVARTLEVVKLLDLVPDVPSYLRVGWFQELR